MKLATAAAAVITLGLASTAQAQPPNQNNQHNNAHAPAPGHPQGHPQGQPKAPRGGQGQFRAQPNAGRPGGPPPVAARGGAAVGRGAFNARAFPHQITAARQFHVAAPAYPGGWYARRWSYGQYLPFGWFAPAYYLAWANYGLTAPPIGCEWVQEGSDAVLVDIATGEVLSVVYNVFW